MTRYLFILMAAFVFIPALFAQNNNLKIAVINMQVAINESNEGVKIKKIMEGELLQAKEQLSKKKQEIESIYNELQTSLILSDDAKAKKQARAQQLIKELQAEQAKQESIFKKKERAKTEELIVALNKIVNKHALEKGYDMVVEAQIAGGILYSKFKFTDITEDIIKLFNNAKKGK